MAFKTLRMDSKGRVTVGGLIEDDVSSFRAYMDKKHRIILEPYVEIPARELWLHQNPDHLAAVTRGIKDSAKGKTKSLGRFSKYLEEKE